MSAEYCDAVSQYDDPEECLHSLGIPGSRIRDAMARKHWGKVAYSDGFNHIIAKVGSGEVGMDLIIATRLRNDLDEAIRAAAMSDDVYAACGYKG